MGKDSHAHYFVLKMVYNYNIGLGQVYTDMLSIMCFGSSANQLST